MQTIFLTSSPFGPLDNSRTVIGLDPMNRFLEQVERYWRPQARCLVISAFPSDLKSCDFMRDSMEGSLRAAGLGLSVLDLWDDRTKDFSAEALHSYDVVFLGGGHVPTQNAFFAEIGLKDCMKNFDGTVLGISAGSMNAASIVYAQPEEEGEAADPNYRRFLKGLGLTNVMLLPHYQDTKDRILDGKKLFEEVTYPDSFGRQFIAICDGSYLYADGTAERICGEAYLIQNGTIRKICDEGEEYPL